MIKKIIVSDHVAYEVEITGKGAPVLLLHGFTGNHNSWRKLINAYQHEFQFIVPSLLGHGGTDAPKDSERYHIEQCTRDLVEILRQLEIEKVHCLGYSMGGRLALALALCHPVYIRSLILESSTAGLTSEQERSARRTSDRKLASMIRDDLVRFVDYWEKIPLFESQQHALTLEEKQDLRKVRLAQNPFGLAGSLLGMGTGSQPNYFPRLSELSMPVLLITGALDQKFCQIAVEMTKHLSNGTHIKIDKSGHTVHLEQYQLFVELVADFLDK